MTDANNNVAEEVIKVDVKQAVRLAAQYFSELYADQQFRNVLLEEIEFDDQNEVWLITFGYDIDREQPGILMGATTKTTREYKTVQVDAETGKLVAVKIRKV